ncbi:neurl4, partial [Symbiodinium pilosum]
PGGGRDLRPALPGMAFHQAQPQPRFGPDGQEIVDFTPPQLPPGGQAWGPPILPRGMENAVDYAGVALRPMVRPLLPQAPSGVGVVETIGCSVLRPAVSDHAKLPARLAAEVEEVASSVSSVIKAQVQEPMEQGISDLQKGPEWAGCDQSPAQSTSAVPREAGQAPSVVYPDKIQLEQAEVNTSPEPGEERRKVEDAAAEATQALRAIAAEAEARVQAERQAAAAEVMAQKAHHDEAMARIQAELSELKAQAAARESLEASLNGAAMARIEAELAELKAAQAKAAARSVETIAFPATSPQAASQTNAPPAETQPSAPVAATRSVETLASPATPSQPASPSDAPPTETQPLASVETRTESPAQPQVKMQATEDERKPRLTLEKTIVVSEAMHGHNSSPRRDVSLDKTIVVVDAEEPAQSAHKAFAPESASVGIDCLEQTVAVDIPCSKSNPSVSFVAPGVAPGVTPGEPLLFGSDILLAVEKARAAVAELQRRAGIKQDQEASTPRRLAKLEESSPGDAPFCHDVVGLNILLSQDGYTATRSCGCRESVAICKRPLMQQSEGRYFEVEVGQTVDGWMGGLGIGVTHSSPSDLKDQRLPDKAWRVPQTFILGYTGNKYLNGKEGTINWQSDQLQVGQRIGLLIAGGGDLHIFVDGNEVAHVEEAEMRSAGLRRQEPLYGIVDVYNATLSVRLLPGAAAPRKS